MLFEAPNWSLDGTALLLNGDGRLWSMRPEVGALPRRIVHDGLPAINNDHVLAPDGVSIFMSASDQHIYLGSLEGGPVAQITHEDGIWHFLHGVSPDGSRLTYVRIPSFDVPGRLAVISAVGGDSTVVATGDAAIDGPEWSPDGEWIYFNSEQWGTRPGDAQVARIADAGGLVERVTEATRWTGFLTCLLMEVVPFTSSFRRERSDTPLTSKLRSSSCAPTIGAPRFGASPFSADRAP